MTRNQEMCIREAVESLQTARKWLDQAMYYSDEIMAEDEFKKVRAVYEKLCGVIDAL